MNAYFFWPRAIPLVAHLEWTSLHTAYTAMAGSLLIFLALIWISTLRSQVRKKTIDLRNQLERERELENRFALFMKHIPGLVFMKDLHGKYLFFSGTASELPGKSEAKFEDTQLALAFHQSDADVLKKGEPAELVIPFELESGLRQWMVHKFPISDSKGTVTHLGTVAVDVTERLKAEQALRKSEDSLRVTEALYRNAITASDGVAYLREYYPQRFSYVGDKIRDLTGYGPEEFSPEIWDSMVQEYRFRGKLAGMSPAQATEKVRSGEIVHWQADCRIIHRDGRTRWLADSSVERIGPNGQSTGSIGVLQDVTERHELEANLRQSQKMESIGQLAAGIAHDFNNIMTIIQGYTSMLEAETRDHPRFQEPVSEIERAARRAAALTRQLLTFSRRQVIQPRPLDLNQVLSEVNGMLRPLLGEHISLELHYSAQLPAVMADPGMMEQIVLNLAVNARDAMPKGGVLAFSTTVRTFSTQSIPTAPRAGKFVVLKAQDTGCGMDSDTMSHLFEPFFTTKEFGKGSGLGLATVYGIVQQHGGWVEVESEVGHGAIFQVFLPACERKTAPFPGGAASSGLGERGGSETILVVEDETALRALVKDVLTRRGYKVLEAGSGLEALRAWGGDSGRKIDLLLTDVVMPHGVSGTQLARELCSRNPSLKVIFTSGYSLETVEGDPALLNNSNFLQKPYQPSLLISILERTLHS